MDVIFLQETHVSNIQQAKLWEQEWGGKAFWSFGSENSCGCSILLNSKLDYIVNFFHFDHGGRLVVVDVTILNIDFRFICVYAPNDSRERKLFFNGLSQFLVCDKFICFGGDFNCVENIHLDKSGGNLVFGAQGAEQLSIIKQDFFLLDPFREKYPHLQEFTWFADNKTEIKSRLDRFYISNSLFEFVESITHDKYNFSDHALVTVSFRNLLSVGNLRGPGYWKCNVSVLESPDFVDDFCTLWNRLIVNASNFDSEWWENCKSSFKTLIITYSKNRSKQYFQTLKDLEDKLSLYQDFNKIDPGVFDEKINSVQQEIEDLLMVKAEGTKIRSRAKLLDNDEKPTKYFLMKERSRAKAKNISKLCTSEGVMIDHNDDILCECRQFYQELYSAEPIDEALADFFLDKVSVLSEVDSDYCEGPITKEECLLAIKQMQNNKSPGLDGLPKEFYAKFFSIIGDKFVEMINNCFVDGMLSTSQRHGLITLICKNPDKSEFLSNWRPISLLNVDYKIISKVLSKRLSNVIKNIVNIDQTCAVPGRSILDNVHLLRNIIDYVEQKDLPCALISLDQSKAFDRVSHQFLFKALKAYGFGPQFIQWVQLLYTDISSSVLVNGFQSEPFSVLRSVRQGCSLSPLLYVLCIEPFAIKIRSDPHISGLKLPGSNDESRISQYADDTTCIITSYSSIRKIFMVSELFSLASGAKLNRDKSSGLWLGSWKNSKEKPFNLKWSNSLKICGILFGNNDTVSENWGAVMHKVVKSINLHKSRFLTMAGKAVIVNTLICSKLWYVGSVTTIPSAVRDDFVKLIFAFIWSNKVEKVKRGTLYLPCGDGGINLIHLDSKLKALHVKHILKLLYGEYAKWHPLAIYWIGHQISNYKSDFGSNSIPHSLTCSNFYSECLEHFGEFISLLKYPDSVLPHSGKCGPEGGQDSAVDTEQSLHQFLATKKIYSLFLKPNFIDPHIYKVFPSVNFQLAWKVNQMNFVDASLRDLSWRILHNILPVMAFLHRFKICKSIACPYCGSVETVSHAFYNCAHIKPLWSKMMFIYGKFGFNAEDFPYHNHVPLELVVFNFFPHSIIKPGAHVGLYFLHALRHAIWSERNRKLYEHRNVNPDTIFQCFLRQIKYRIRVDFFRFKRPKFKDYWCQNPQTCDIFQGSLHFCI